MENIIVWDVCTKHDVAEGAPNRTLESAFLIMANNRFRRLPITKIGKIHGILTVTDLLRAISELGFPETYKASISSFMTVNPKTINLNKTLVEAAKIMTHGNFGSLIVTGEAPDRIQGIITERDILRASASMNLGDMKIKDIDNKLLTEGLTSMNTSVSLLEAIKSMYEKKVHRVVITEDGKIHGIMSANDITKLVAREREEIKSNPNFLESLTVKFLSSSPVNTVSPDTLVHEAVETMAENSIGGLPIVDKENLVGMFTERSLVRHFGS